MKIPFIEKKFRYNKPFDQYSFAIISSIVACVISKLVSQVLNPGLYLFSIVPVLLTSWVCGFWPGIISAAFSLLLYDYFIIPPSLSEITPDQLYVTHLIDYLLFSLIISSLTENLSKALTNEQQARKEAEEANRIKDHFLAVVSHELRTPLTAISLWVQLLQKKNLAEKERSHAIEVITRNIKMQSQMIEDLMDLARISNGKIELKMCEVNLNEVIERAIDVVKLTIIANGIELNTGFGSDQIFVLGDPDRLQQVFWNLLSNSIKFTDKGGIIEIKLIQFKSHLEISIRDSGKGINPEFLPHVFDSFRQADDSNKKDGLGLGLSIVRHLVERHGGNIRAASEGPGKGATFTVSLPVISNLIEEETNNMEQAPAVPQSL